MSAEVRYTTKYQLGPYNAVYDLKEDRFLEDAEVLAALNDGARLRAALERIRPLLGGWREVIAELDDMAKPEALGAAMWACLDQLDATKADLAAALAPEVVS